MADFNDSSATDWYGSDYSDNLVASFQMTLLIAIEAIGKMIALIAILLLLRICIDKAVIDSVKIYQNWKNQKSK